MFLPTGGTPVVILSTPFLCTCVARHV